MAEVLPAQSPGGGLRRSRASQTSLLLPSSPPLKGRNSHSRKSKRDDDRPSSKPAKASKSALKSSRSSTSLSRPPPSTLRRTESETTVTSPRKNSRISVATYDLPPLIDHEENQAPPSSPLVTSPPKSSSPPSTVLSPNQDFLLKAGDDTAIKEEPSRHVDYLSHEWKEEDLYKSWRHIVSKRRLYGERSRLENASWRTWAKQRGHLSTVAPQTLNWMKDSDVTWLYGPLQTADPLPSSQMTSESHSRISKSNSFLHKKPILKKRSMSEMMLQKSLSTSSLIRQAAAEVQAQQKRSTPVTRRQSDFTPEVFSPRAFSSRETTDYFSSQSTSGLQTPQESGERKHIRFANKVEQCIAVELKETDFDEEEEEKWQKFLEEENDEEAGGIMMAPSRKRRPTIRRSSSSRRSSMSDSKTIAKLPATTLKDRQANPEPGTPTGSLALGASWGTGLSPSASQETLRPSNPARNFLLPADDDEFTVGWTGDEGFGDGTSKITDEEDMLKAAYDLERRDGLRRTESGMLMPIEDDDPAVGGVFGRVIDTVNTAKDIAHVIWNVGFRR